MVYDRWELQVPEHIANWDTWTYWERPRFDSIAANMKWGDVLIDVGAEHGWLSALFARYIVGGDAMILVEPSPELWRNVRLTWEANRLATPRACLWAFADRPNRATIDTDALILGGWPAPALSSDEECPAMAYRNLREPGVIPSVAIDDLVDLAVPPGYIGDHRRLAINMDIDGPELRAIQGAKRTIETLRPLCWISIHDDLIREYGDDPDDIFDFFSDLRYDHRHLGTDHERHELFYDATRRVTF